MQGALQSALQSGGVGSAYGTYWRRTAERVLGPPYLNPGLFLDGLGQVLAEVAHVSSYLEEKWLTRREIDVISCTASRV
jgi:hypothetical protein